MEGQQIARTARAAAWSASGLALLGAGRVQCSSASRVLSIRGYVPTSRVSQGNLAVPISYGAIERRRHNAGLRGPRWFGRDGQKGSDGCVPTVMAIGALVGAQHAVLLHSSWL